jgi:sugar phosphate isomerase/epimerase
MELKLACADFTFPLLPHDHVLELIAMLKIPAVDVGIFGGRSHIRPEQVLKNIRSCARELSVQVRDRGLEFSDIFLIAERDERILTPNHPDPAERHKSRDQFLRILEFAARCNAGHMSGLPGMIWESEPAGDSLKRSSEELAWRLDQAQKVGIIFSVEAHIGSIVPTPEETLRLLKMTPGLTLTLDYTHFTYRGDSDDEIEPLLAHASHFHVRGGKKGRVQESFKNNVIDYARVLRKMEQTNYQGYVCLEYTWEDWQGCNEVDNLSETIQFRDFLRSVKPAEGAAN